MSLLTKSKHPAYHLRPNKAVDRAIFLELLQSFENKKSLSKHSYIGMGGPFLEDFRLMAQAFPKMKMISIEKDQHTYKRQQFHKCTKNMTLIHSTFENFLSSKFPSSDPCIAWADYTDFERKVLLEVATMVRAAVPLSIIRITVRAVTSLYRDLKLTIRKPAEMPAGKEEEFKQFVNKFRQDFDVQDVTYDDSLFTWENFTEEKYPNLLSSLLYAVITAACTAPKTYLPLHSVKYSDGTIMLSITGMICVEEEKKALIEHFKKQSEFFSDDYQKVELIDVPMLTTKERLHLEGEIPPTTADGSAVIAKLGYSLEENEPINLQKMKQYEKYHRYYPYFGKLVP